MKDVQDVKEFMHAGGQDTPDYPQFVLENVILGVKLIAEEVNGELMPALIALCAEWHRLDTMKVMDTHPNLLRAQEQTLQAAYAEVLDAITDGKYVLNWLGLVMGLPVAEAWEEVQRSNMDKFPEETCDRCQGLGICAACGNTGKVRRVIKNEHGKVQKPAGWRGPDLYALLDGKVY